MHDVGSTPRGLNDWRQSLAAKAAAAGLSMSEYLLSDPERKAPLTMQQWLDRLQTQPQTRLSVSPADIIREARGEI